MILVKNLVSHCKAKWLSVCKTELLCLLLFRRVAKSYKACNGATRPSTLFSILKFCAWNKFSLTPSLLNTILTNASAKFPCKILSEISNASPAEARLVIKACFKWSIVLSRQKITRLMISNILARCLKSFVYSWAGCNMNFKTACALSSARSQIFWGLACTAFKGHFKNL